MDKVSKIVAAMCNNQRTSGTTTCIVSAPTILVRLGKAMALMRFFAHLGRATHE